MALFTIFHSQAAELDSLIIDPKPGRYRSPLYLKVLSVFDGKLYYELEGRKPTPNSSLYKGIIKLSEPRTYQLKFLFESALGDEKYFGPFLFRLSPPKGYSENIPEPSLLGGVYDSVLLITFQPIQGATIHFSFDDSNSLAKYSGQQLMLDTTSTLYYKAFYGDTLSTDIYSEHYEILLEPPKVFLTTKLRKFNFEPKLKVKLVKANQAYYSLDPLAPFSSFIPVQHHIELSDGHHFLRLYATNLAGMRSKEFRVRLLVDTKAPAVKYYVNTKDRLALLQINEPGIIYYTTDNTAPGLKSRKYSKPIPLPVNGILPIRFFAVDTMGNESIAGGFNASADVSAPKIGVSPPPGAFNKAFNLEFTCSEPCLIRYTLNGQHPKTSPLTLDAPPYQIKIAKEGKTTVKYIAQDKAENTSAPMRKEYIIDTRPPEIHYTLKMLATSDKIFPEFKTNEPASIHFTLNGATPTQNSQKFFDGFSLGSGANFKFIAVDPLGNQTEVMHLDELKKPMAIASPAGGIFNKAIQVQIRSPQLAAIQWSCTWNGANLGPSGFSSYNHPVRMDAAGVYVLRYRVRGPAGPGNIHEQMYIIDKAAPRIVPILEKSARKNAVLVRFETNEPTKIFYTLNGKRPSLKHSRSIGSVLMDEALQLTIKRKEKIVLKYLGIDGANNMTQLYVLDLFSPHVTLEPPPGLYNNIVTLNMKTQPGNTIYYSSDSSSLTARSRPFLKPIILSHTKELWFFATDITGFAGPKQKAVYRIHIPPTAGFTTVQNKVYAKTTFQLDGSLSSSDKYYSQKLTYRWDLNGDGLWDTQFSENPIIDCIINTPGIYPLQLEVQSKNGLTGKTVLPVQVHKRCPLDMASLMTDSVPFCIDRYEWPGFEEAVPKTDVNWAEAAMLCKSKGRRLCKKAEWEYACRGIENTKYPYGNKYESSKCATSSNKVFPGRDFPQCVSYQAIYSLVGNVWEWLADVQSGYYLIAGGSYAQGKLASCGLNLPSPISSASERIGFRCCE